MSSLDFLNNIENTNVYIFILFAWPKQFQFETSYILVFYKPLDEDIQAESLNMSIDWNMTYQ